MTWYYVIDNKYYRAITITMENDYSNNKSVEAEILLNDNRGNETVEEYLLRVRGPKHLPLNVVVPITVVYVAIFVTGVLGNVAVCMVIVKNVSLHTATNYYIFSLAISDLTLLLLGLPNDLSVYWQQYPWIFGEELCKLRALVSEMTSYTSVLTIVAFSMERYLAICHPLHSYAMSGLRRAIRIIAALWIIGFISATPFAIYTTVDYLDYPIDSGNKLYESAFCAMLENNLPPNLPIYELSFILFFLVPMVVIIILYTRIGWRIRHRTRHSLGKRVEGAIHHGETKQTQSRKSIIRMLAAVVMTFFLCWAPFHAQRLIYIYARDVSYYSEINEWMYYIAGCFYYFSSTVNPILYNVMSVKYRIAFRKTLCGYSGYSKTRGFSRDVHSSFRETLKTNASLGSTNNNNNNNNNININSNNINGPRLQRTLTWRQASKRSTKSNATDVLVMIAPASSSPPSGIDGSPVTEQQQQLRTSVWRQTLLRFKNDDDEQLKPEENRRLKTTEEETVEPIINRNRHRFRYEQRRNDRRDVFPTDEMDAHC